MATDKKWLPLESNPDIMNTFLIGVGVPEEWSMVDIFDMDEENLPRKVKALLLLFPKGIKHEEHCTAEEESIESEGQTVSDRVYFMKLDSNNSSGTVSIIHAVANSVEDIGLLDDSSLKEFLERTKEMTPEERGQELEMDEDLCVVNDQVAKEGQTVAPDAEDRTDLHFITFVAVDEQLYELDSHKNFPVNHGSTTAETFIKDAIAICKQFMERDPDNINFSSIAFVGREDEEEEDEADE